tara:strand:- start:669 stop:1109 length:441 start_codon:yes stop_codon:yes gene_type:complete
MEKKMNKIYDSLLSMSEVDTINFGKKLSEFIKPGDIYTLKGDLGAGKTTFIKGVLKGLGYEGLVTSPTYTLINEYMSNPKVIHIDCYRENNLERWKMIGINEYFDNTSVIFIEWPEILDSTLPLDNIYKIQIKSISKNKRNIEILK